MFETIDIVLRTIAVMASLLLAGLLLANANRRPAALPGGLFSLAAAAFFVTSAPGAIDALGVWAYPLVALCVTKAVWFWLFARLLFNDNARLLPRHLVLAVSVAVFGTWQQTVFVESQSVASSGSWETVFGFGFDATIVVFVLLGLQEAWRGMAGDLVERRRQLRLGFVAATGVYLALALGVQTWNLLNNVETPALFTRLNMTLVAVAFMAAAWFLLRLRSQSWLDPSEKPPEPALSRVEAVLLARLKRALEEERVFLQEGLTVGALAGYLGTSEHILRRVINHGMGHRNFNDFLHAWRIREACEELARPDQARLPVLSIAMKVGYGSIGAFNRAFKARVGMTPTDYRRHSSNGARSAP